MAIDIFIQKKLKQLRKQQNLTLEQLAKKLDTTAITLSRYETGKRSVSLCILEEICQIYGLTIPEFFNGKAEKSITQKVIPTITETRPTIFVYGEIAAGNPLTATEEYLDEIEIPSSLSNRYGQDNLFGLAIRGESMNKIVQNQDYVILNKQKTANNGDIVAVLVNNEEATLKRFYKLDNETIILKPESNDPDFQPITIDLRDNFTTLDIIGKLVWHCAAY